MIRLTLFLLAITTFLSCKPKQDQAFQIFFEDFQNNVKKENLFQAIIEKKLIFDSVLVHPKETDIQSILAFSKEHLNTLHTFEKERLDVSLHEHHDNVHSFLTMIIKNLEEEKIHSNDPSLYSILSFIKSLTLKKSTTLSKGLRDLKTHYQVAIENLKLPTLEKLDGVVTESIASYEYLDNEIKAHIHSLKLEKAEEKKLMVDLQTAQLGLKDYIGFCNSKIFDGQN